MTFEPRSAAGTAAALALLVSLVSPTAIAAPSDSTPDSTFELMNSRGSDLPSQVTTAYDRVPGDGAGMTYSITSTKPDGDLGRIAIPLADGSYAVPEGLDTSADTSPSASAVQDAISRAQTFVDAGGNLEWDASRPSPLTTKDPVHQVTGAPYAVTCASFVGMVLTGLTYNSSTYVANTNTPVGTAVDFKQTIEGSDLWQANHLAAWFYANGDMWLDTAGDYQPGDVLFFSKQNPENSESQVRSGSLPTYFANIYHTAIYLGDGQVAQATGPGRGVTIDQLRGSLKEDVTFVARPYAEGASNGSGAQDPAAPQAPTSGAQDQAAQPTPTGQPDQEATTQAADAAGDRSASSDPAAGQGASAGASVSASGAVVAAGPAQNDQPGLLARTGVALPVAAVLVSLAGGFFFLALARRRRSGRTS